MADTILPNAPKSSQKTRSGSWKADTVAAKAWLDGVLRRHDATARSQAGLASLQAAGDPWLMVRTRPGAERRVRLRLLDQGAGEAVAPYFEVEVRHARKVSISPRPLYPGYVLLRAGAGFPLSKVRSTIGAVDVVPSAAAPQAVPFRLIAPVLARVVADGLVMLNSLERRALMKLGEFDGLLRQPAMNNAEERAAALARARDWLPRRTLLPVIEGLLDGKAGTFSGIDHQGRIGLEIDGMGRAFLVWLALSQVGDPL